MLSTKIDPAQAINRFRVCITAIQNYSKYFLYVGMTLKIFRDKIKEHKADRK